MKHVIMAQVNKNWSYDVYIKTVYDGEVVRQLKLDTLEDYELADELAKVLAEQHNMEYVSMR